MPSQHKNPGISWHPDDPTLKPWIKAEAGRREITDKALLDEALGEYRAKRETTEARAAHIDAALDALGGGGHRVSPGPL